MDTNPSNVQQDIATDKAQRFPESNAGVKQGRKEWPPLRRTNTLETGKFFGGQPSLATTGLPFAGEFRSRDSDAFDKFEMNPV